MSVRGLHIPPEVVEAVMAHARAELPNEACGMVAGPAGTGRAVAFHAARNADASPHRYHLDPEDQVRITYAIERVGHELLAIVHSHPRSPAVPSATDRRDAAAYPGVLQLVASLAPAAGSGGELRAWRIDGRAITEVPLLMA
jgi:proteasome lid subunit RPN8/RPN11